MHKTSGKRIGQVLVEMKLVSREELGLYLKQQIEEIIYNLFSWKEGEFVFREGQLPASREGLFELNTMNVIMEGTRRIDEWVEIQKVLPRDNQVLCVSPTHPGQERRSHAVAGGIQGDHADRQQDDPARDSGSHHRWVNS